MEIVYYKGKKEYSPYDPFGTYLENHEEIEFGWSNTSCWKGYQGIYKIHDNKLYLISLDAKIEGVGEVDMSYFFPNDIVVFADWFSEDLWIPTGKSIRHPEDRHRSIYEKYIYLTFKNGVLIEERVTDNSAELEEIERQMKLKSK